MNELEENWAAAMNEAERQARELGRNDVIDYLRLREANDAARRVGIEWLLNTFLEVAEEANRRGMKIKIEKSDAHRFAVGAATMQGSLIRLGLGVRTMTIEAGFPRLPQDGFVRGNGLACARISHFGISHANEELLLTRADKREAPAWFSIDKNDVRHQFLVSRLKHHFAVFLGTP
ncbi:MAG TPA: hypothetical protein VEX64_02315 [Pyrinomonadaceae bacterium]|nr:hypothetical protein [Pyrinomonadaceae bacterium]